MNQTYMKEKPILPLLLSMALPMVISMMVNSLYNIVDSYFVARISEEAMTALSLVYPPALSSIFEWNGPLTFNRTALFAPAAFKDSAAFSTAAVFPVITICPGQL